MNAILDPIMAQAAKKLGLDHVQLLKINAPVGKAPYGPLNPQTNKQAYVTGANVREALDKGAELFGWEAEEGGQRPEARHQGARHRRRRRPVHRRVDRLRRPGHHPARRQGAGADRHRQPRHRVGVRLPARLRRGARHAVGAVRDRLGQHRQGPAVELRLGRQPDGARDDPRRPRRRHRPQDQPAGSGRPGARRVRRQLPGRQRPRVQRRPQPDVRRRRQEGDRVRRQVRRPRGSRGHQRLHQARRWRRSPARASSASPRTTTSATATPTRSSPASPKSKSTSRPAPGAWSSTPRWATSAPSSTRATSSARPSADRCSASATRWLAEVGLRQAVRRGAGAAVPPQQAADASWTSRGRSRSTPSTSPIRRRRSAPAASASRRWAPAAARWRRRWSMRSGAEAFRRMPITPDLVLTSIEAKTWQHDALTAHI